MIDWKAEAHLRQGKLLADLTDLLAVPSVKDMRTATPETPLGVESARALAHVLALAEREGLRTVAHKGVVGYAEFGPTAGDGKGGEGSAHNGGGSGGCVSAEYVAVLSHVDVVPATGDWTTPPFAPTVRDGKVYARGALDDKGPAMAAFYALLIVKELGLPLRRRIRLIFGADEETGMACMDTYNKLEPPPIAGFTPDADFPIVHAEKGQVNVRMMMRLSETPYADGAAEDPSLGLASFVSGTAANMVPDTAEAVVQGSRVSLDAIAAAFEQYCTAKKLKGSFRPDVADGAVVFCLEGKSAHGMAPESGNNAGLRLLEFLGLHSFTGVAEQFIRCACELFVGDTSGEALGIACRDDVTGALTVNVGLLRFDRETDEAYFQLNIRFPSCGDGEAIMSIVRGHVEKFGFVLTAPSFKTPHQVPADHPMIRTLQRVYREETGNEATLLSTGGGTYASKLPGCVAFGPLFPGEPDTAHQPDENISIDSLLKMTAIYARAIFELANLE